MKKGTSILVVSTANLQGIDRPYFPRLYTVLDVSTANLKGIDSKEGFDGLVVNTLNLKGNDRNKALMWS